MRRLALVAVCAVALAAAGCGAGTTEPTTSSTPAAGRSGGVTELRSVDQLRAAFDAHDDVPRLVLLASPT